MRSIFGLQMIALAMTSAALADPCEADLPKPGTSFGGPVSYIVDGDGLCVGSLDGGVEVRLADFNAPELNTPEGKAAKAALSRIASGKQADCVAGKRSYDRVVAVCSIDGRAVGDLMRDAGMEEGGR